ncbi:MAG: hypothetical protein LBU44_01270 [Mediterranea sp.]|jgi:hypothetical protein|nr:hypothetical protein [Mediterranea sp.]
MKMVSGRSETIFEHSKALSPRVEIIFEYSKALSPHVETIFEHSKALSPRVETIFEHMTMINGQKDHPLRTSLQVKMRREFSIIHLIASGIKW